MSIFTKIKPKVCLAKLAFSLPLIVPVIWLWHPLGVPEIAVLLILAYGLVSLIDAAWRWYRKPNGPDGGLKEASQA